MKFGRTLKNILMILMIVLLGAGAWLTMDYAGNTLQAQSSSFSQMGGAGEFSGGMRGGKDGGMTRPEDAAGADESQTDESGTTLEDFNAFGGNTQPSSPEQNGDTADRETADSSDTEESTDSDRKHGQTVSGNADSDSNAQQGGNMRGGKPPQMQGGQQGITNGSQPPEMPSGEQGEMPAMPDGEQGEIPAMSDGEQGEMPAMPDGEQGEMPQAPEVADGAQSSAEGNADTADSANQRQGKHEGKAAGNLDTFFYILFAVEWIGITALVLYLILSGFNKKGLHATVNSMKNLLIYAMCALIIGTALGVLHGEITRKVYAGTAMTQTVTDSGAADSADGSKTTDTAADAAGAVTVDGTDETLTDSYAAEDSDESAILVTNGGTATVKGAKISKTGDSSNTENSEFYGVNAAVLVQAGSTAVIDSAEITTDAKGANAVFATGENAKITITNTTITTTGSSSSRGLDATYGGTIEADHITVTTQGGSCAALATDRGEGEVAVTDSTLETNGSGSPVIYSTGDISITNTTGTANGSQMVVIEGKNSATVTNATLTASAKGNRGSVDQAGIMIYQSMSGDASEGTGTFTATDSSLSVQADSDYYTTAPMFFITNTDAVINLTNTKLSFGSGVLISAMGTDEWGSSGKNGGNVTLNAENQTLTGDIEADAISAVTLNLTASSYEGAINGDNTASSVTLTLDSSSTIKLTGDSYVTALNDADSTYANIDFNGYTLYVNGVAVN